MPENESKGTYLEAPGKALVFVQGLDALPKAGIIAVVLLTAGLLVYLILQKPSASTRVDEKDAPASPSAQGVANSVDSAGSASTGTRSGSAASSGQMGGITAGNFYQMPPATEQQKAEALSKLEAELDELKDFPDRPLTSNPPTILENMTVNKIAFKLYAILGSYYKTSVTSVPRLGGKLRQFQTAYYQFQTSEAKLETSMLGKIALVPDMKGSVSGVSVVMLRYLVMRLGGVGADQITKLSPGIFEPFTGLNDGLKAEGIFDALKGSDEAKELVQHEKNSEKLVKDARSLLDDFRRE